MTSVASASAVAQAPAPAPMLDVVGVKLGMPVDEALAAVKADNPKLTLAVQLEGFDQSLLTGVLAQQAPVPGRDTESLYLQFTTQPGKPILWGVQRTYSYIKENMPAMDITLAALRKKYGPENIPPDPAILTKNMAWIFDAQGKLASATDAKALNLACNTYFTNMFGGQGVSNDIVGTTRPPAQCGSITMITASIQASREIIPGSTVVYNLLVQVTNGPLYRPSMEATRAVLIAAVKVRENEQNQEVDKRGGPKSGTPAIFEPHEGNVHYQL